MKSIIIYTLALMALTSCSKNEEATTPDNPTPQTPQTPREIRISAAIEASAQSKAVTRADVTPLTGPIDGTADIAGIQFLRKDDVASKSSLSFEGVTAITGTRTKNDNNNSTTTDGDITFDGTPKPQYDLVNNHHAYFAAYYPAGTVDTDTKTATFTIDGKTDILYAPLFDAGCYAAAGSVTSSTMTFSHALAQLEVVCKAESGVSIDVIKEVWGKIKKIEIATKEKASYAYSNQEFTFSTDENGGTGTKKLPLLGNDYKTTFAADGIDIPTYDNSTVNAAGMFAPAAESNTDAITLTITTQVNSGSAVTTEVAVQLKDGSNNSKGFERGLKHTATLTFKSTTKEIKVTGTTITPWGTGYTGTGDVTPNSSTPPTT